MTPTDQPTPARKTLVRRVRRKLPRWGGRYEMRIYSDGSAHMRFDHPSNDPVVEMQMGVDAFAFARQIFIDAGLPAPVPGPMRWRNDPE